MSSDPQRKTNFSESNIGFGGATPFPGCSQTIRHFQPESFHGKRGFANPRSNQGLDAFGMIAIKTRISSKKKKSAEKKKIVQRNLGKQKVFYYNLTGSPHQSTGTKEGKWWFWLKGTFIFSLYSVLDAFCLCAQLWKADKKTQEESSFLEVLYKIRKLIKLS